MKLEWNKKLTQKVIVYFLTGLLILCAYFILKNPKSLTSTFNVVIDILRPFIFGFVFAYLLNTPMNFFDKLFGKIQKLKDHLKIKRSISIFITWILAIAFLTLFFYIVVPDIRNSIVALANNLPGYYDGIVNFVVNVTNKYGIDTDAISGFLDFNITPAGVLKIINTYGKELVPQIENLANIGFQVGNFILDFVLSIIISIYFMFSKETLLAQVKKLQYALFSEKTATNLVRISRITDQSFSGFINGKIIDSFIIGVLCFIGMTVLRFEYPVLISFIIGVTNVIPVFGPFFGAIPSVLLLLIINPWHALWFAVFVLALQQLDGNVIGPKILGDSTGLPAIWVMFAILVGGGLFGVLGMFVGVPSFAVIYKLIQESLQKKLEKKKLPTETESYKIIHGIKEKDDIELMRESKKGAKNDAVKESKQKEPEEEPITENESEAVV